ncbi:MAG: twin-arginine translocation signal domain-containing protein [Mycobacteriales bacterium]
MTDRLRWSWRALSRRSLLGGCAAAAALGVAASGSLDDPFGAVLVLRGAAVLLACAVAFAVDDPSYDVLAASPTPLRRRVLARVGLAGAVAAGIWCGLLLLAAAVGGDVPAAALSLEAAALASLAAAGAVVLQTWRGIAEPGLLMAPAVAGAVLAANLLPARWALLAPAPGAPGWEAAHQRWTAVLCLAVLLAAVGTRDRAAGRSAGAGAGQDEAP